MYRVSSRNIQPHRGCKFIWILCQLPKGNVRIINRDVILRYMSWGYILHHFWRYIVSSMSSPTCTQCTGKNYSSDGASYCEVSSKGCNSFDNTNGMCKTCYSGHYIESGTCHKCAPGTYNYANTNKTTCQACEKLQYSGEGASKCNWCSGNCSACDATNGKCTLCKAGYILGNGKCTSCTGK